MLIHRQRQEEGSVSAWISAVNLGEGRVQLQEQVPSRGPGLVLNALLKEM
jgi:hypothetical protein